MENIVTRMGDKVSRIVLERTCRGNTTEQGKEEAGQETNGLSLPYMGSSTTTCNTC